MSTYAQIINGQALNVIHGASVEEAKSKHFAPGYDGGNPGVDWELVPDGTQSGAKDNGNGAFTNPPAPPEPAAVQPTKAELLSRIDALVAAIEALPN